MIRIVTDSASDITQEEAKQWNITVIPLTVRFLEEQYLDGVNLSREEFYEKLIETDVMPKTSQATPFNYEEVYEDAKKAGDEVLVICLSSKLSGCYQSANIARDGYEDMVEIVDSTTVTIGEKILVQKAIEYREQGLDLQTLKQKVEEEIPYLRIIALVDTLEYLQKGGRLSATAALFGKVVGLRPVLTIQNGEIKVLGKARGSKSGYNLLIQYVTEEGGIDFTKPYNLGYSGLSDMKLQKYIQDSLPLYKGKTNDFPISCVGTVIGAYAGPNAVIAAFFAKSKKEKK